MTIYLSIHLSIYLSIYRSIDISIYRSIDLSIYLSMAQVFILPFLSAHRAELRLFARPSYRLFDGTKGWVRPAGGQGDAGCDAGSNYTSRTLAPMFRGPEPSGREASQEGQVNSLEALLCRRRLLFFSFLCSACWWDGDPIMLPPVVCSLLPLAPRVFARACSRSCSSLGGCFLA